MDVIDLTKEETAASEDEMAKIDSVILGSGTGSAGAFAPSSVVLPINTPSPDLRY